MKNEDDHYLISLLYSCPFWGAKEKCAVRNYRNGHEPQHLSSQIKVMPPAEKNELLTKHTNCFNRRNGEYLYKRKYGNENGSNGLAIAKLADSLTSRELEVVRLIADGKSGPEIAKELKIHPSTFKNHKTNIYEKLQVNNKVEFLWKVIGLGMFV